MQLKATTAVMNLFFAVFGLLAVFTLGATASPVVETRGALDVWTPPVTSPNSASHWYTQETQVITWDTSNPPVNITNKIGQILLRANGLTTPLILANNFSILDGNVSVTVPWVVPGSQYQVNLFGDSGDFSAYFSINQ